MLRQDLILLQTDGWVHKKIPIKSSLYNHPIIQFKLIFRFQSIQSPQEQNLFEQNIEAYQVGNYEKLIRTLCILLSKNKANKDFNLLIIDNF